MVLGIGLTDTYGAKNDETDAPRGLVAVAADPMRFKDPLPTQEKWVVHSPKNRHHPRCQDIPNSTFTDSKTFQDHV